MKTRVDELVRLFLVVGLMLVAGFMFVSASEAASRTVGHGAAQARDVSAVDGPTHCLMGALGANRTHQHDDDSSSHAGYCSLAGSCSGRASSGDSEALPHLGLVHNFEHPVFESTASTRTLSAPPLLRPPRLNS